MTVDVRSHENVERLHLQKVETSTSLLTPAVYCVLIFTDEVKSTNVTHKSRRKQRAITQKCSFLSLRSKKSWIFWIHQFHRSSIEKPTRSNRTETAKKNKIHPGTDGGNSVVYKIANKQENRTNISRDLVCRVIVRRTKGAGTNIDI